MTTLRGIAAAALLAGLAVGAASTAQAEGPWVAMVSAPCNQKTYWDTNAANQQIAETHAMAACRNEAQDCRLLGSTQRCMAAVMDQTGASFVGMVPRSKRR